MTTMPARFLTLLSLTALVCLPGAGADVPATAPEDRDPPIREQSIYVPYEKLWQVFEEKGRGVFLPYEEFQALWQKALDKTPGHAPDRLPADALISRLEAQATVTQDVVRVRAQLSIEVLKEGWNRIPLRLSDVALASAELDGKAARIVFDPARGYELLVEKQGKDPAFYELALAFAKSYTRTPGRNSVQIETPPVPVSRWDVRIPEPGVKVDLHPLLAATDVPAGTGPDETRVLAFVGSTPSIRIEWTPQAEGAKGLAALASVQVSQEVRIEEGVVQTRASMAYEISRTEIGSLALRVPADQKVVNVYDPNVREWSVQTDGPTQTVTARLFEPTKGAQALVVELEKFGDEGSVSVPVVEAVGVGRQQGVVALRTGEGLRAAVAERRGLLQLDAADLPADMRRRRWDFAYRYAALPYALSLNVEIVQPRILVDSLAEIHVGPRDLTIDTLAVHDVQRAGVFTFDFTIPPGLEVRQVSGGKAPGAAAAEVDSHHVSDEAGGRRLTVNLSRRAEGRVAVALQLHRPLDEPDLLAPTGNAVSLGLPFPRSASPALVRENGRVVVYGPESLRVNPTRTDGLRAVPYRQAVRNLRSTQDRSSERPVLSFGYTGETADLAVDVERRAPHVTVRQLLLMRIEAGVVKYDATFFYDIRYSGVSALRLDVPSAQSPDIRVTTPGVRKQVLAGDAQPAGTAEGFAAWQLAGETEFLGTVQFRLKWEQKIQKLEIGRSVQLDVPRLVPREVDRAWGQIVLAKAEAIDVAAGELGKALDRIDPARELMPGARVGDAAQAFEFHEDWALSVTATRYEPREVKVTSIERALVRAVLTRSDLTSVQAVYRMRSARQRLVVGLPENVGFDAQPIRINGRPVSLEQGEPGEYFVPLVTQEQDRPFLLELRYVVTGAGRALECPSFPGEPAVQQVYLSVHMPRELTFLGSSGAWNPELVWTLKGFTSAPRASRSEEWLIDWVTEGIDADRGALRSFATDGRHLLFSTLRPQPGPAGVLVVRALQGRVFQTILLVLILGGGACLLAVPFRLRLIACDAALIALILLSVFGPSLARSVVNNGTVAAILIVAILWLLWYVVVARPRDPAVLARREAREAARSQRPAAFSPAAEEEEGGRDDA